MNAKARKLVERRNPRTCAALAGWREDCRGRLRLLAMTGVGIAPFWHENMRNFLTILRIREPG